MKIELNLLDNGLDFILQALKHVWKKEQHIEDRNVWKYSVLNFFAGVELIFKEKLKQEHWSLIFDDVSHASELKLSQGDFVSVNHSELMRRLKGICDVTINDEPLNDLRKLRNRFEHFEVNVSVSECKETIAKALQVVIEFWGIHILPICDNGQNEKFQTIKSIVASFDTYVEITLEKHAKIITNVLDNGAGVLIPCNNCGNKSFLVFREDGKECKCFVCDKHLHKQEYIQEIREQENHPFSLLPKDEYQTTCQICKKEARVKFYPRYYTDEITPDFYYCINCLHYEREPTIEEQVERELAEKLKELEKNYTPDEIIQILTNELNGNEDEISHVEQR